MTATAGSVPMWRKRDDGSLHVFVGDYSVSVWRTPRGRYGYRVSRLLTGSATDPYRVGLEIGNPRYAPDETSAKRRAISWVPHGVVVLFGNPNVAPPLGVIHAETQSAPNVAPPVASPSSGDNR